LPALSYVAAANWLNGEEEVSSDSAEQRVDLLPEISTTEN
jgi:hypothetical protein